MIELDEEKDIYELRLHEMTKPKIHGHHRASDIRIMRVHGGWLYSTYDDRDEPAYETFVPYKKNYMDDLIEI